MPCRGVPSRGAKRSGRIKAIRDIGFSGSYLLTRLYLQRALEKSVGFVYASSAATYRARENDLREWLLLDSLRPFNMNATPIAFLIHAPNPLDGSMF